MQTVIHFHCSSGESLRENIAANRKLESYDLFVVKEQQPGRKPGWLKIKSNDPDRRGALNIQWEASQRLLTCRVVNKGRGKPHRIIGDFIDFLLATQRSRIRMILISPM